MIYTAITSGMDNSRNDILVFSKPLITPVMLDRVNSRIYKILSHLFVQDPSIYIDGNITMNVPEEKALELLEGYDLVVFRHPWRKCVSEEVKTIVEWKFIAPEVGEEFLKAYPDVDKYGLFEGGAIMRSTYKKVSRFNERWWALYCRWPVRDQITLPIAIMQSPEVRLKVIECNHREHPFFNYHDHAIPTTATT